MDTQNLATLYDLPALDWDTITAGLDQSLTQVPDTGGPNRHTCWLTTVDDDGAPHTTGIGGAWVDGSWSFETGLTPARAATWPATPAAPSRSPFTTSTSSSTASPRSSPTPRPWPGWPSTGGRRLALPGRRERHRVDRRLQRAVGRQAAVARLPGHARSATAVATVEPGGATRWSW